MISNKKRILLVVDGSDQSSQMVDYAGKTFAPDQTELTLFHVMDRVPEAFWDWEADPLEPQHLEYMKGWENQKEEEMRRFMDRAREGLLEAGFSQQAVSTKLKKRESGIARDIICEARTGYDALMIGRRGLSTIDERLIGSVAGKIVSKLTDVSVCVVGGNPQPDKLLLGLDASQGALDAVGFVAGTVGGREPALTFMHVLRKVHGAQAQFLPKEQLSRLEKETQKAVQTIFDKASEVFAKAGGNPSTISSKTVAGAASRAGALIEEARQEGFGTVVVGRRGVSKIEEFQMGRVANKLIQLASDLAIWIVS